MFKTTFCCALLLSVGIVGPSAIAADDLYAPQSPAEVKTWVLKWIDSQQSDVPDLTAKLDELWKDSEEFTAQDLLDKVVESFVLVDPATKSFVEKCAYINGPLKPLEEEFEDLPQDDEFYLSQMQLFYGRYLAQRKMYDEALFVFEDLDPKTVIDPASYFFFRTVCEHQLFMKAEGLSSVENLLQNTEQVPSRYSTVATLMQYDLQQMEEKSLGHVASKMNDSERRLELARSGQRVQKVQGEIVTMLDEIIEKLEQQQGGGSGSGNGNDPSNTNQSSSPAQVSQVKGATGPGKTDDKEFKDRGFWGNLPEKEENRANNIINQNFPTHYRKAIEEYTKELAKHPEKAPASTNP